VGDGIYQVSLGSEIALTLNISADLRKVNIKGGAYNKAL
jgi:hypothetical protein